MSYDFYLSLFSWESITIHSLNVLCMWLALSIDKCSVCGWHYLSASPLYVAGIICMHVHCMWLALSVYKSTVCGWHYVSTSPLYVAGIMCLQVHCMWLALCVYKSTVCGWHYVSTSPLCLAGIICLICLPWCLRCPLLWLRTIAGKSTCGGPWLSPGKPTRRAVTTMGSSDLVIGEDDMLGPSCQRYNWQTGRCGSIAFGSSPRRGKTLISNPHCLAEVSTCGKDFRR